MGKKKWIVLSIVTALILCAGLRGQLFANAEDTKAFVAYSDLENISQYGNLTLMTDKIVSESDLNNAGIEYGDLVEVSFLDQKLQMPVVRDFGEVAQGELLLHIKKDAAELAINMDDFASTYIADITSHDDGSFEWTYKKGIEGPVEFTITLKEKQGYYKEYQEEIADALKYTDERSDYPQLSDEEFANFRVIATTGMGKNILYRTSSPINPKHKRSTYADAAIEKAGVVTIMNLADSMKKAKLFKGYAKTYYSTTNFVALDMGLAFNTDEFRKKMAEGLVFFANNKGPYAVHCKEGKNRAGVASALLECFMGATYDEIVSDYMVTYYNYYGIKPGDKRYDDIAQKNIVATLQTMFNVDDLKTADLSKEAEEFFKEIGLSDEDIENLRNNLSESRSDQ